MCRTHGLTLGRGAWVKSALPILVFCTVVLAPRPGAAQYVDGSLHDFSPPNTNLAPKGSCTACHIPHAAGGSRLWARSLSDEAAFYGQTSNPNYLPGASLQCYDCHDDMLTVVDRDPPDAVWGPDNEKPQDIAFGGTFPGYPLSKGGTPLVGYYEEADGTLPTGIGSGPPSPPTDGSATGGHFWRTDPSDTPDKRKRGDKIACALCHDPHRKVTGANDVFFRTVSGEGTGLALGDGHKASANTRAGAEATPSGNGRSMCEACHGNSDQGVQKQFFNVTVPKPTDNVPEHIYDSQRTATACTDCHPHNRPAGCNDCHGYPPLVAADFDRVDQPDGQSYPNGAGAHLRHRDALGLAIFKCEICHGPDPGELQNTWHATGGATVQQQNVDIIGQTAYWGAAGGYSGTSSTVSAPSGYAFAAKGGGNQRCFGLTCHGAPPNVADALNWTDDMLDEATGNPIGDGLNNCKWCHDGTPAKIGTGQTAPNVLGDNTGAAGNWTTGTWGADVNGHGLAAGNYEEDLVGEATRIGVPAANKQCTVCHDGRYEVDPLSTSVPPAMRPVKGPHFGGTSKRLRDTINGPTNVIADNPDNTCIACHQVEGGPDSAVDSLSRVVSHGNSQADGYKKWEADTFRRHCRSCHEPHGANWNGVEPLPRNLHMLGKWVDANANGTPDGGELGNEAARVDSNATGANPDVVIDSNDLSVVVKSSGGNVPATRDNSWDDGNNDGRSPSDSICVVCHQDLENNHSDLLTSNLPQGTGHLPIGTQCRLCHQHGEVSKHPNSADDAFGPLSCFACHGVTTTDTVPGEISGQFWPAGRNSVVPEFNYSNDDKGSHRTHIEALSQQIFGEPASELVQNDSTANPGLTSSEKQTEICWFCHYDPGGADATQDPLPHFEDTATDSSPTGRVDVLQSALLEGRPALGVQYLSKYTTGTHPTYGRTNYAKDTTGGAYNFTTGTCANLVCHNQTATPPSWNTPPDWSGSNSRCSNIDCHAAATYGATPGTAHPTHLQSKPYECYECHANNSGTLGHGNGKVDMAWNNPASLEGSIGGDNGYYDKDGSPGVTAGDTGFGYKTPPYDASCNLVYCHGGDGAALQWGGSDTAPVWDDSLDRVYCGSCHRANQSDPRNPNAPVTGNHTTHLSADWGPRLGATSCLGTLATGCHAEYALTTDTHVNGSVEFNSLDAAPAVSRLGTQAVTSPTPGETDRCTRCHSALEITTNVYVAGPATVTGAGAALAKVNWSDGAYKLPCLTCHNPPATAGTVYPDGRDGAGNQDYAPDMLGDDTNYGAEVRGHNRSLAAGNYPITANPPAARFCAPREGQTDDAGCHDRAALHINGTNDTAFPAGNRISSFINGQPSGNPNQVCRNCHTYAGASPASKKYINRHSNNTLPQPPRNEDIFAPRECLQCHEAHGMTYNGTGYNIQMISPTVVINTPTDAGTDTVVSGVRFEALEGPYSFNDGDGNDDIDICVVCHKNTNNPGYSMYDADGQHANLADYSNDERGSNCSTCHTHNRDYPANPLSNDTVDGFMPLECNACHTFPEKVNLGNPTHRLTASHDRHVGVPQGESAPIPSYGNVIKCPVCHYRSTHNNRGLEQGQAWSGVTDAMVQVRFDDRAWPTGWNPGASSPADRTLDSGSFNESSNVCSNLYCHGDDTARFPATDRLGTPTPGGDTTPEWGVASTAACGTCHRVGAGAVAPNPADPPGTLSHPVHSGTGAGEYGIGCPVCHYNTTNDGASIANAGLHVSRTVEVSFNSLADQRVYGPGTGASAYGGTPDVGAGYGSCTNTYCHSKGTDLVRPYDTTAGAPAQALVWDAEGGCWSCHGNGTNSAVPAYASGSPKANKHPIHAGSEDPATSPNSNAYPCQTCHWPTTRASGAIFSTASHVNRAYEVDDDGAAPALDEFTFVPGTPGTCDAAPCHGGTSGISWGQAGPIACDVCHSQSGGTPTDTDVNSFTRDGATQSKIGDGDYGTVGHGAKTASCAGCHASVVGHDPTPAQAGANPFRLRDNGGAGPGNFTCADTASNCHDGSPTATVALVTDHTRANMATSGYTPQVDTWSFTPKCVDCHDPHGDDLNLSMVQRELYEESAPNWVPLDDTPENAALVFTDNATAIGPGAYAWTTNGSPSYSGVCQECHESGDGDFTSFKDGSSPVINTPHPGHTNQSIRDCSFCHRHSSAFAPTGCEGCHNGDGDGDGIWTGVGYDPDGDQGDPAAPNVMGGGVNPDGVGWPGNANARPYDDGTWGYNVNGHGANGTAASTPTGLAPSVARCDGANGCHDISVPAGTHLDGVLNSVELKQNQNQNTAHLIAAEYIGGSANPYDVQVAFDQKCFNNNNRPNATNPCHRTAWSHRHAKTDDVPPQPDPVVRFGDKSSVADGDAIAYPTDSDISTNAAKAQPDFAPCISCHNPHGTQTPVDPEKNTNLMLRDSFRDTLCNVCHL